MFFADQAMKIPKLFPRGTIASALLLVAGCGSPPKPPAAAPATESPAKILAFYPRETMVTQGEATVLCYGVSDAESVHIDPPVDGVWPALNRCVEVRPKGETLYTLTAEGADGKTVTQSVSIHVGADAAALPKITSFQAIGKKKDYSGQTVFTVELLGSERGGGIDRSAGVSAVAWRAIGNVLREARQDHDLHTHCEGKKRPTRASEIDRGTRGRQIEPPI